MGFSPRPEAKDVDRKYTYLFSQLTVQKEVSSTRPSDEQRSSDLCHFLLKHCKKANADILDYAGGNGRLMSAFASAGHTCSVVDYTKDTIPQVRRLGDSLEDVPTDVSFDVIICSHVLEHLVEPIKTIKQLAKHLRNDAILYTEVPLEIWDGVPRLDEPVTHINFFSPRSLQLLLEEAGLTVISCEEGIYTTEEGGKDFAIRAVAQLPTEANSRAMTFKHRFEETRRLISPKFSDRVRRLVKYPETRRRILKGLAKRYLPAAILWRLES